MDDNRNNRTDYEPNFILKESPIEEQASAAEPAHADETVHTAPPAHVDVPEYTSNDTYEHISSQ